MRVCQANSRTEPDPRRGSSRARLGTRIDLANERASASEIALFNGFGLSGASPYHALRSRKLKSAGKRHRCGQGFRSFREPRPANLAPFASTDNIVDIVALSPCLQNRMR